MPVIPSGYKKLFKVILGVQGQLLGRPCLKQAYEITHFIVSWSLILVLPFHEASQYSIPQLPILPTFLPLQPPLAPQPYPSHLILSWPAIHSPGEPKVSLAHNTESNYSTHPPLFSTACKDNPNPTILAPNKPGRQTSLTYDHPHSRTAQD